MKLTYDSWKEAISHDSPTCRRLIEQDRYSGREGLREMINQGFVGNISQEDLDEKGKRKLHHYVPIWFQRGFTDDDGLHR